MVCSSSLSLLASWLAPTPGIWHIGASLIAVEWSCSPTFSPLLGEAVVDKLKSLHYTIRGLVSVSLGGPGCGGSSRACTWGRWVGRQWARGQRQEGGLGRGTGRGWGCRQGGAAPMRSGREGGTRGLEEQGGPFCVLWGTWARQWCCWRVAEGGQSP